VLLLAMKRSRHAHLLDAPFRVGELTMAKQSCWIHGVAAASERNGSRCLLERSENQRVYKAGAAACKARAPSRIMLCFRISLPHQKDVHIVQVWLVLLARLTGCVP